MDKLFSFKARNHSAHMQHVQNNEKKLNFYSEEEKRTESSEETTPKQSSIDGNHVKSISDKSGDCSTDESETNLGEQQRKCQPSQLSIFRGLNKTSHINGDIENEPEISDWDANNVSIVTEDQNEIGITKMEVSVELARKIQQKLSNKVQSTFHQRQNKIHETQSENDKKSNLEDQLSNHFFRHLIFGPKISQTQFNSHLFLIQKGLTYATKCLKHPPETYLNSRKVKLDKINQNLKKILVLDLDETLIHSCPLQQDPQVVIQAKADNGAQANIGFNVRPYTFEFLQLMSQFYTIYIYTASSIAYAKAIINYLDSKHKLISGILSRNNCMVTRNGFFIKDLRIITDQLNDIILVDNLTHSFGLQINNGVPILEWHNDKSDQELKYLSEYLIKASQQDDIREFNKQHLRLLDLINYQID